MPKIKKFDKKSEQNRKRVRIFRGAQAILRAERNMDSVKAVQFNVNFKQIFDQGIRSEKEKCVNEIRSWAIQYNVQRRAVSALLKILIVFAQMTHLPKDSRTLLKTPRVVEIVDQAGGRYWHHGIRRNFNLIFAKLKSNLSVKLNFNIDGLPLFKSSPITFYPILCNIHGTDSNRHRFQI